MIAIFERERPNVNWKEGSSQDSVISEYGHLHFSARPFAVLTGMGGPGSGSYIFLTEQSRRIIIGREAKNISIDDRLMSRQHCLIQVVPDEDPEHRQRRYRVYIVDLGSDNGTFVDGAKITERKPLANGSKIQIGASTFVFAEMPDFS